MKISKRKQVLSLLTVITIMLAGSFLTVNAATNGELAEKIKDTIKVIFVDKDGNKQEVKGNTYTDNNNHIIEEYRVEDDEIEHIVVIDKTLMNDTNLVANSTVNENGISIVIDSKE